MKLPQVPINGTEYMSNSPNETKDAFQGRLAVSVDEAARMIGVGRTFLYAAIAKKELKSAKVGGRRLVTADALRSWLAAHSS